MPNLSLVPSDPTADTPTRTAIIVCTARATVEETWRVQVPTDWTADDLDDLALDLLASGEFLSERVLGDEEDRDLVSATFDEEAL